MNIKWLRRLEISDAPFMTREETSKYTDIRPDGKAVQFSFEMEAKSVITSPSGGMPLDGPGFHEITGLAWSGRGTIRRVDVSVDGGSTWREAALQQPVLPICHTRFRIAVAMGRQRHAGAAEPLRRRHRLRPADARPDHRPARPQRADRLDLPPERDPELAGRERRKGHQCPPLLNASRVAAAAVAVLLAGCAASPRDDASGSAEAAPYGFGQPATPVELARFFSPLPDGRGLPKGSGTVAQGKALYEAQCVACHGDNLQGGLGDRLIGGRGTLVNGDPTKAPVKTVESYWPYATTLFDYIKRAMPLTAPDSLSDDEVYALCAYILSRANVIAAEATHGCQVARRCSHAEPRRLHP